MALADRRLAVPEHDEDKRVVLGEGGPPETRLGIGVFCRRKKPKALNGEQVAANQGDEAKMS